MVPVAHSGGDDGSGEREQRSDKQQPEVGADQADIDASYTGEEVMVVHPDGADVEERSQQRQVGLPLGCQGVQEGPPATGRGLEIEDQQGERDGEHPVAERLDR